MKNIIWPFYLLSFGIVAVVAALGSLYTKTDNPWYRCVKAGITPPNIVFPVVWTILYILIAIVLARELQIQNNLILSLFFTNLAFNVVWCYFYFTERNPILAFATILIVLATAFALIIMTKNWLLIPYVCWLIFATILNGMSLPKVSSCAALRAIKN